MEGAHKTAALDRSQCPAVEGVPGKRSGAWVFRGTRTPISTVFENLQDMGIDELVEEFGVTREQVHAVLRFVAACAVSALMLVLFDNGRLAPWPATSLVSTR